jgi:hypothetical protein
VNERTARCEKGSTMSIANNFKKLAFLSLLTMGLAACGHTGLLTAAGDKTPTSNSKAGDTSTPAQRALLASGEPQAVVTNAMLSLKTQPAYRVRSTSVVSVGGGATTSVREFVAPDRTHIIEDGREVIIIGKTMYIKNGGEWQNLGTQMSDMAEKTKQRVQQMSPAEKADATKGLAADYKSLGDETLDGIPTAVYEMHGAFDTKVQGVGSIVMVTKYWIAKSDGLLRKDESDGEEAGMKVKTTSTYEYDPNITIEAPIP